MEDMVRSMTTKCVGLQRRRSRKIGQVVCKRRALLTDHNGDVPNGYAQWACTPLRQWCDRIPILAIPILAILILAIPILAIHPNRDPDFSDPDFSDPDFSDPDFSDPDLGDDN
jgi:hypothetical protein